MNAPTSGVFNVLRDDQGRATDETDGNSFVN
jgi:hypothetical protein